MANAARGEIETVLGGARFVLRFDANALAQLEGALHITIGGEPADANNPFLTGLILGTRAMLWAALLHNHPGLTLEQAGNLITPLTRDAVAFRELRKNLLQAYSAAWPDTPAEAKESDPNAQAASAGVGSDSPNSPVE